MKEIFFLSNRLIERIEENNYSHYYPVDLAYHMTCGKETDESIIKSILDLSDEEFIMALENAINIEDL